MGAGSCAGRVRTKTMRTLIGALLAMTALSPTLASAQGLRVGAEAQVGRGGSRDSGPGRGPDARDDRPAPGRFEGDRAGRGDDGPQQQTGRDVGPRGDPDDRRADRAGPGPRQGDRWAGRDGSRSDGGFDSRGRRGPERPRAANDWTRDRLDARDAGRTRDGFADRAAWNRGWRGDDRYDWNDYRTAHRGAYRLPRYYAPGGGGYRRVAIGVGLQASLWNRNYWIADPYAYRLPKAYGPYRWVRYYDDALLVDLNSGRVVDAVYGIFW